MIWYESHFSTEHILERYISLIAVCTLLGIKDEPNFKNSMFT